MTDTTSLRELSAKWDEKAARLGAGFGPGDSLIALGYRGAARELREALAARAEPQAGGWVWVPREAVAQAVAALDILGRRELAAWLMRAVDATPPASGEAGEMAELHGATEHHIEQGDE